MAFMTFEGLKDGGTFLLDATTKGKIASNPQAIVGKTVAYVASRVEGVPTVGYGTSKDNIAGVVTAIEPEKTGSTDFVVTVSWNNTFEGIATASTTTTAVVGKGLVVDGKGGVETSTAAHNAMCMAVAGDSNSCIIRVL